MREGLLYDASRTHARSTHMINGHTLIWSTRRSGGGRHWSGDGVWSMKSMSASMFGLSQSSFTSCRVVLQCTVCLGYSNITDRRAQRASRLTANWLRIPVNQKGYTTQALARFFPAVLPAATGRLEPDWSVCNGGDWTLGVLARQWQIQFCLISAGGTVGLLFDIVGWRTHYWWQLQRIFYINLNRIWRIKTFFALLSPNNITQS